MFQLLQASCFVEGFPSRLYTDLYLHSVKIFQYQLFFRNRCIVHLEVTYMNNYTNGGTNCHCDGPCNRMICTNKLYLKASKPNQSPGSTQSSCASFTPYSSSLLLMSASVSFVQGEPNQCPAFHPRGTYNRSRLPKCSIKGIFLPKSTFEGDYAKF